MTFLEFILSFSLLLTLSSFFILAWHRITRHTIIINPDNTETTDGFIFKFWSIYWEKIIATKRVYYSGEALQNKMNELSYLAPAIYTKITSGLSEEEIDKAKRLLNCSVEKTKNGIILFIEEDIYRFPSWVRMPISQCVLCMSSIYGSLFYWGFVFLVHNDFLWTFHKNIVIILLYPIYSIILSNLSSILSRKIN